MNHPGGNRSRRRYRFNGKKLAGTLLMLAFIGAVAVVAAMALRDAGDLEIADMGGGIPVTNDKAGAAPVFAEAGASNGPSVPASGDLDGRVVVVDAGHGGFDPGAIGVSGTEEDDLNLAVAQFLKAELEACGVQVIMTREDENAIAGDKDADMAERRRIIKESGSDIVVSVHMNNFIQDPDVSGPLVLFTPGSEKGKTLAEAVQTSLNAALDADGTARSENLYVLKSGSQPSVLVECGYLSNKAEENNLRQPDYQQEVAKAICDGVTAFFAGE